MPLTPEQLAARRNHLGSSDLAAILGKDPFRTPTDVYLEKTADLNPWDGNEATELGNSIEPFLLKYAAKKVGQEVEDSPEVAVDGAPIVCHLDGRFQTGEPIEAKTYGLLNDFADFDVWGDDWTDEVPARYAIQCLGHLAATKAPKCYLPALIGGKRGLAMFVIPANETAIRAIVDYAGWWWDHHIIGGREPRDGGPASIEILRRVRRTPGKIVGVDDELVERAYMLRKAKGMIAKASDQADAELLFALGDAEIGQSGSGDVTCTTVDRAGYTVQATSYTSMRLKPAPHLKENTPDVEALMPPEDEPAQTPGAKRIASTSSNKTRPKSKKPAGLTAAQKLMNEFG